MYGTSKAEQNGPLFAEDIFKCIFLNENLLILIKILLKFVQVLGWSSNRLSPVWHQARWLSLVMPYSIIGSQWVNLYIFKYYLSITYILEVSLLCLTSMLPIGHLKGIPTIVQALNDLYAQQSMAWVDLQKCWHQNSSDDLMNFGANIFVSQLKLIIQILVSRFKVIFSVGLIYSSCRWPRLWGEH